jgi:hypothetical protein
MIQSYNLPTKKDVKELPRDTEVEVLIYNYDIKPWNEIIKIQEKLDKFDNPDQLQMILYYENKELNIKASENFPFFENPTSNTKLGKFLLKYSEIKLPMTVKIKYDKGGKGKIVID